MQDIDRPAHVEPLSEPARRRRPGVDVKAVRLMPSSQRIGGLRRHCSRSRARGYQSAIRPAELQFASRLPLDLVALFMHRAVMTTAKQREIRQRRRAAVRPMADMMPLPERQTAAREATAAIAMLKRTS